LTGAAGCGQNEKNKNRRERAGNAERKHISYRKEILLNGKFNPGQGKAQTCRLGSVGGEKRGKRGKGGKGDARCPAFDKN